MSGRVVDVNTALEAGQKFVGEVYKTSMENGMIKYTSKDGTKTFRLKNKIKNADYEALKNGRVITNYHVVIKQN